MADIKTFKDIDKKLQKLVEETKENFKITKGWQKKLDKHAEDLIEKVENDRKPRAKVQKEMLRALETTEAQSRVRARDQIAADFKTGKATLEELKAARLTKEDFVNSGFGTVGSNIEMMRQWWQESIGKFGVAVKNWWKWTKENSIVWQSAKKFWNSEAVKKLRGMASQVAGIIKGHMSDILGEFQQVFDFFKQTISLVWTSIKGAFTGMFDILSKRRQRKREEKMVSHLQKIKDGIGFLVKGTKLSKISNVKKGKGSLIDKLLDLLGLGSIGAGILLGLKAALFGLLGKFLLDGLKGAIEGWRKDGLRGVFSGYITGFTSLPRKILGYIGDKILTYIGLDGEAFKNALSNENTKKFIEDIYDTIEGWVISFRAWLDDMWTETLQSMKDVWKKVKSGDFIIDAAQGALSFIGVGDKESAVNVKKAFQAPPGGALQDMHTKTKNIAQKNNETTDLLKENNKLLDKLVRSNEKIAKKKDGNENNIAIQTTQQNMAGQTDNSVPNPDSELMLNNTGFMPLQSSH